MVGGADGDVVIVEPEVDLVAWFDPELVSQLLGDDDLPFGADTMSHTIEYNHEQRGARAVRVGAPSATLGASGVDLRGSRGVSSKALRQVPGSRGGMVGSPGGLALLDRSRLNVARGIADHMDDPFMQSALGRWAGNAEPAMVNLHRLAAGLGAA